MAPKKIAARIFTVFKKTILEQRMIVPGDRVLAALSGGPDSVALVALLLKLRGEMPLEIRLAHFNHRLRDEADEDERFVRNLARRWVLPLAAGSADVRSFAAKKRLNLEEAGRDLRYGFLRRAASAVGATKIATGHTMTDQAETVLMRLMRGTGLAGLAGIAPVVAGDPCPVVRPLLGIPGPDLRAWLEAEGIPFREDASNRDRRYLRNRVRAELLPELERRYEPRAVAHVARLASIAREEDELLGGFVRELADEFILRKGRHVSLDLKILPLLPPALARRVAREYLRELLGDLRDVSYEDVEALVALGEAKDLPLRKGLVLRREAGLAGLKKRTPPAKSYEVRWDGRGELVLPEAGLAFKGLRQKADRGRRSFRNDDRTGADLDAAGLEFPLVVRNRRPGDIYRPFGAPGRKKIKEILRAKGIPAADRDRLPVVLSRGEIVWVPGLPVGDKYQITGTTEWVFSIRLKRGGGRRRPRRVSRTRASKGPNRRGRSALPRAWPRRPPGR
ncbi:MAG: tRNA lysidine(34) synthetase TilS [Candidatus Aminicenantes bacterium RBG_16_63_14]|nr:MAG: tRNA lysidine(34) synthetase TilS [Candidatus Aminicenantes bacterium RBG_16_63_14]